MSQDFPNNPSDITHLLKKWHQGETLADHQLFELVYSELRSHAKRILVSSRMNLTLQATEILHETFLRLSGGSMPEFESRRQFFAYASHMIRGIMVDHARKTRRAKRGGGVAQVPLEVAERITPGEGRGPDWLALDEALAKLEGVDPLAAKIVELRYFGGLNIEETALVLEKGSATVSRKWRFARAWLKNILETDPS